MKSATRVIVGVAFMLAGLNHFVNPDFYVRLSLQGLLILWGWW